MLEIRSPRFELHWLQIVTMTSDEICALVPGLVRRDFRVVVPNANNKDQAEAVADLIATLAKFKKELDGLQAVRALGAIIPAPEGAAAILRVMTMPDAEGHFPEDIHKAVFANFATTVTAIDNHVYHAALQLIDLAAGIDLQEGVA